MSPRTALVLRATGSQGKSVIKHLTKTGWNTHALVSEPSTERALALKSFGDRVSLHKGAIDDPTSVQAAIEGCNAVFLTQMPSWTEGSEAREARIVIEQAKAAGVRHILYTTNVGIKDPEIRKKFGNPAIAPAITGKLEVEQLVRESGIPWTILRPGWFMSNVLPPMVNMVLPGLSEGNFVNSYTAETVLAAVDTDDIGAFTAAAFNAPDKFVGQVVPVVSEMITVKQMVSEFERATGKQVNVHYRTVEESEKEANNPFVLGQMLTGDLAQWVDMDEIRSWGIPLTTFREFLERERNKLAPN